MNFSKEKLFLLLSLSAYLAFQTQYSYAADFNFLNDMFDQQKIADLHDGEVAGISTSPECVVAGCSNQLCVSPDQEVASTCEYLDQYACLSHADCEVQESGECGWTYTNAYNFCVEQLADTQASPTPTATEEVSPSPTVTPASADPSPTPTPTSSILDRLRNRLSPTPTVVNDNVDIDIDVQGENSTVDIWVDGEQIEWEQDEPETTSSFWENFRNRFIWWL